MLLLASLYVFITQCNKLYFQYSCHSVIKCIFDIHQPILISLYIYLNCLSVKRKENFRDRALLCRHDSCDQLGSCEYISAQKLPAKLCILVSFLHL